MATVYKSCNRVVAHLPEVRAAVRAERDVIYARAQALFAAHDRPGGHRITTENGRLDAFVVLEGPAPLSVEYGRAPGPDGRGGMEGLHILGRAADL